MYSLWSFWKNSCQFYANFENWRQTAHTSGETDIGHLGPTKDGGRRGEVGDGRHRLQVQGLRGGGLTGGGEERLDPRRWPCLGRRGAGFRLSFMRCLALDQLEESAADLAARPIARLGAEDLGWEWCWQRWYVIKRSWERPRRLFGSLFRKGTRWWFISSSARVVAG